MEPNTRKFSQVLKKHKELISLFKDLETSAEAPWIFRAVRKTSDMLCLEYADYKCQICTSEDNLTRHHLVTRKWKNHIPLQRYWSLRHYWNNILILCSKCHKKEHGHPSDDALRVIPKRTINKVRRKMQG